MKKKIAVLYGGRSGEHEVSVRSAASIMEGLDKAGGFEVLPVFITKNGTWLLHGRRVAILPDPTVGGLYLIDGERAGHVLSVDVVFPVLHGTYGEDGTVQGLLELAQIPYVGAGVAGSAIGMDKILMKAALAAAGIPVGDYLWFNTTEWSKKQDMICKDIEAKLGYPCFVKPANLGSSVGISKAYNVEQLKEAAALAFEYDRRVLVEKMLVGLEIECSVLGNDEPEASVCGQIIPCNDFYDYKAKYVDDRSTLVIPAKLSSDTTEQVRKMAVDTFLALDCAGFARVDFFVNEETGDLWVNEINTIPGFTVISMYPKLWEASGLPFGELLKKLVDLAAMRAEQKKQLKTSFEL